MNKTLDWLRRVKNNRRLYLFFFAVDFAAVFVCVMSGLDARFHEMVGGCDAQTARRA